MTPLRAVPAAVVRPVVIDPAARRFLLLPAGSTGTAGWTLPALPVRAQEPCRRTVLRHLRRERRFPAVCIGAVVGRLPTGTARPVEEYVVLAAPACGRWPRDVRVLMAPGACWWDTAALRKSGAAVEPETLPLFLDGYWEGWLPGGVISLE
ncbi:hypothetical protein [Streptomyces sp. CoH27]|uniref:hypothetical protein n=1 Tax=Streptomyces sp. CoH27 TaxID=2875763 RepID=UPI001CD67E1E|nr:hypothetical protein [Streptomyces sp. CoH27]